MRTATSPYSYYIDGELVSPQKALAFYREAFTQAVALGCAQATALELVWGGKQTEAGREHIHNVTGCHELGGLEIVSNRD